MSCLLFRGCVTACVCLALAQVHPAGGFGADYTTVRFASVPVEGTAAAAADAMRDVNGALGGASGGARLPGIKKASAHRPLDFVVADDLEATGSLVACAWLGDQVSGWC